MVCNLEFALKFFSAAIVADGAQPPAGVP